MLCYIDTFEKGHVLLWWQYLSIYHIKSYIYHIKWTCIVTVVHIILLFKLLFYFSDLLKAFSAFEETPKLSWENFLMSWINNLWPSCPFSLSYYLISWGVWANLLSRISFWECLLDSLRDTGSFFYGRKRCSRDGAFKAAMEIGTPHTGIHAFARGFTSFHWHLTRARRVSLLFNITYLLAASLSSIEELLQKDAVLRGWQSPAKAVGGAKPDMLRILWSTGKYKYTELFTLTPF